MARAFRFEGNINWFPGHMTKASKSIEGLVKKVDLIVEVRDARIPFSSVNSHLESLTQQKKRLVVCNKSDLSNSRMNERVRAILKEEQGHDCLFTSVTKGSRVMDVIDWAKRTAKQEFTTGGTMLMVIGMPNVGKSSLINALKARSTSLELRGKRSAKVGPTPGVTLQTNQFKIAVSPAIYMVDTPGVFVPKVEDPEVGWKLALTGAVRDSVVGETALAEFLLYTLNLRYPKKYCEVLGLQRPCSDINFLLSLAQKKAGVNSGMTSEERTTAAARYLLKEFRRGAFGQITLDDVALDGGDGKNTKPKG